MKPARLPGGTPAPYGRACQNCAHAKCKCMLLASGGGCERCQRLGKECRPTESVRKPNQRSSASKFAKLEAKVDYVLATYPALQGNTACGPPNWEPADLAQNQCDSLEPPRPGIAPTPTSTESSPGDKEVFATNCVPTNHEVLSLLYIPPAMAQDCLNEFRTNHLQYLPFVYIPRDMTSDQLQSRYPFFWVCIMDVLTPQNTEKGDSFRRITHHIHQRVMIDAGSSMDLLLGMVTFISWGAYSRKPFLNSYVHILMGVIAELGINQSALGANSAMQDFKFAVGMKRNESGIRTLEERRAVLGCFLLSSSTAISMSRIDAMRWTPHMEESLSVLTEAQESPEDEVLVAMVKLFLVLDRLHNIRRDGDPISSPAFYLSALKMQLDAVKQEIPTHLMQHRTIRMYLHSAEFTINEMALEPSAILHLPDLQRLECLFTSLQATKLWLDIWLELSAVEYVHVSSIIFFQWARAILNLYRLTILEDPTWSKSVARDTVNILDFINKAIMAVKCRPEFLKFEQGKDFNLQEKGLRMLEALKCNWEPKLIDLWGLPATENPESTIQSDDVLPPGMSPNLPQIDDSWMMEFLGSL